MMKFRVIEGGLSGAPNVPPAEPIGPFTAEDVRAEAARRIRASGFEQQRLREFMTGRPISRELLHLQLQILYAAEALMKLGAVPEDFRSDRYWPAA